MPLRIKAPPVGGSGLPFTAITGLTATHANRKTTLTFQAPGAGAAGIVVFRLIADDEAEATNNPFKWFRMTPRPLSATSTNFVDKLVLENRGYTYRLAAVDARGNFSAFTDVQITTPQWVSSANFVLWSEDLTKSLWVGDSGVTVAANANPSVNGHQITFPSADKAFSQSVPVYPLNTSGRGLYTGYIEVKGTAGQKISGFLHADPYSSTGAYQLAPTVLTGNWDPIYLPRPAASTADRYVRIGLQTYTVGGVACDARVVSVRFPRVAAGTLTQAAMLSGYVATQGPGSVRAEPIEFRSDVPGYYNLMDQGYAGYHRSDENTVPAILCNASVGKTLSLSGAITVSRGGSHVDTGNAYPARTVSVNSRHFGLNPLADNVRRGRAYRGDYQYRVDIQNGYMEHTAGLYFANLRTNGLTDKVTILRNKILDTDGRRATAAGGYVKTPWSDTDGNRPGGALVAWERVANIQLNALDPGGSYTTAGAEIAYNELYARPGFSRVEDSINLSGQQGTASAPARVHHNLQWPGGPWDYAWFDDAARLTRSYQYDKSGNPGDTYYSTAGTFSGSVGMPVDSSLHSTDLTKNGKYIEWYSNVNLGAAAVMGLLDGQNVTIEQNHTAATGNLPSGYLGVPVPVIHARQPGYQVTHYYTGYGTVSAISGDRLTITLTGSGLQVGGTPVPQYAGGKLYKRLNNTTNANDTANSIYMGTNLTAQTAGTTTIVLSAAAPAGLAVGNNVGYSDEFMTNNLLRRNTIETAQTSLTQLADNAVLVGEQFFRNIPGETREWDLYGSWQALMADSGNTIGPTT